MKGFSNISEEIESSRLVRLVLIFAVIYLAGFPTQGIGSEDKPVSVAVDNRTTPAPQAPAAPKPPRALSPTPSKETSFSVAGWLPFWDTDEGLRVVREFPDVLDEISPFWYKLGENGAIEGAPGAPSEAALRFLKSIGARITPTISGFDATRTTDILNDAPKRAAHISHLVNLVIKNSYDGIDIDYESLHPQDRDVFSLFIEQLSLALHEKDKKLTTTVYAKTSFPGSPGSSYPHDYKRLGQASDSVRIMAYDQHYSGGIAGPIASLKWVEAVIDYAVTQIPEEKLILGVPAFGYDWAANGSRAKSVVHDDVAVLSQTNSALIQWDEEASSPFMNYEVDGLIHTVWFENFRSMSAKIDLARTRNLGGVIIWRLGREDKQIYRFLADI